MQCLWLKPSRLDSSYICYFLSFKKTADKKGCGTLNLLWQSTLGCQPAQAGWKSSIKKVEIPALFAELPGVARGRKPGLQSLWSLSPPVLTGQTWDRGNCCVAVTK